MENSHLLKDLKQYGDKKFLNVVIVKAGDSYSFTSRSTAQQKWKRAKLKLMAGIRISHCIRKHRVGIHNFVWLREIGCGGSGKVFLARMKRNGALYAIKVQENQDHANNIRNRRTQTEYEILLASKHPFITPLYYAFQNKNRMYFVLEYCSGGDLEQLRQCFGGQINEQEVMFYAAEIVLGLEYLHALGYVYRDLKPQNVLLHQNGHIRLTDFGISEKGSNSTKNSMHSFETTHLKFKQDDITNTKEYVKEAIVATTKYTSAHCPLSADITKKLKSESRELSILGLARRRMSCFASMLLNRDNTRQRYEYINNRLEIDSTSFVGTMEYMSPEVIKGRSAVNGCRLVEFRMPTLRTFVWGIAFPRIYTEEAIWKDSPV